MTQRKGWDDIPMSVVKKVIEYIKSPLLHIFNKSFLTGIFPSSLKIAKMIPIYKKGCKKTFGNYRPISILPALSKIIERAVYNRLESFFQENNIISEFQNGFVRGKSTTTAALSLTDHILESFDNSKFAIAVLLDFSKAFETVNHSILIKKLEYYGVRNKSINWIKSYLKNRKHFVKYNEHISPFATTNISIPQGSILGPLLFNVYINDLSKSANNLNTVLFADDSCFYCAGNSLVDLFDLVNTDLRRVFDWVNANKLTINFTKSHYIVFNNHKKLPLNLPQLRVHNHNLLKVEETCFLGLIIDNALSWKNQIENTISKLNKYRGILYRTRHNLTMHSMKLIYFSLIYSALVYSNPIWGNTFKTRLHRLFVAQKNVIRTMCNQSRYSHTNELFKKLELLKLEDINKYFANIFTYRSINRLSYPFDYFTFVNQIHNVNLRNAQDIRPPQVRNSRKRKFSPSFYCADMWNSLPPYLKLKPTLASFKSGLKNFLLSQYQEIID